MLSLLIALLNSWMCLQSVVALKQSAFIFLEDVARRSIVVMPCACSIKVCAREMFWKMQVVANMCGPCVKQ